ncbi:MAG: hypothetical protein ACI9M9_002562 [Flavobacteriaceae bacterium]
MNNKSNHTETYITVRKYEPQDKLLWDIFIEQAKNATFLFSRDFIEYHKDRFTDYSLLVHKGKELVGLVPANLVENKLYSHQGLTYGGLVLNNKSKLVDVSDYFAAVLSFLNSEGIDSLYIKLLPNIYHLLPSDELQYLLFITEAKLVRTDVSSTIELGNALKIKSNRMEGVKKAKKHNLRITEGAEFDEFWDEILVPNLKERHNAAPVHSLDEIKDLNSSFPNSILQFNVYDGNKLVAGATIFETKNVTHAQYISANADKQTLGSLDFLFEYLIKTRFKDKKYFDFGTSNENSGKNVNKGLQYWKECFGARSIVHQTYEVKTSNYLKIKDVFI